MKISREDKPSRSLNPPVIVIVPEDFGRTMCQLLQEAARQGAIPEGVTVEVWVEETQGKV